MFLEPKDGIPTALMLVGARAELEEMRDTTIPGRRANGRGRYRKYDTARMACISGKLLPALMYGKWPSPEDRRALTLVMSAPEDKTTDATSADFAFMREWSRTAHVDPRTLAVKPTSVAMLQFAGMNNPDQHNKASGAPRGRATGYRSTLAPFIGKTLFEIAKSGSTGTFSNGLDWLRWVACNPSGGGKATFNWKQQLKKHVGLLLQLVQLERDRHIFEAKGTKHGGTGVWQVCLGDERERERREREESCMLILTQTQRKPQKSY